MFKKFIDGKPVIVKSSSKNLPSFKLIKNVYSNIPDNKHIPLVFETKQQYLNEYIANQERKKKTHFTQPEIKAYKKQELSNMKNVVSRYTTNHNPFIDRRTVFFTDKKISNKEFKDSAQHEFAHELWEKNPKVRRDWNSVNRGSSPTAYGRTDRQEDFAESYMLKQRGQLRDPKRAFIIDRDVKSKNSVATSVGLPNYPPEILASPEWKLYGGPKYYNPSRENKGDLKFNVKLASKDQAMGDFTSYNKVNMDKLTSGNMKDYREENNTMGVLKRHFIEEDDDESDKD